MAVIFFPDAFSSGVNQLLSDRLLTSAGCKPSDQPIVSYDVALCSCHQSSAVALRFSEHRPKTYAALLFKRDGSSIIAAGQRSVRTKEH